MRRCTMAETDQAATFVAKRLRQNQTISPVRWPQITLARSPGRPRPRKELNAVHRGDRTSRHSANARSVPNGCQGTDPQSALREDAMKPRILPAARDRSLCLLLFRQPPNSCTKCVHHELHHTRHRVSDRHGDEYGDPLHHPRAVERSDGMLFRPQYWPHASCPLAEMTLPTVGGLWLGGISFWAAGLVDRIKTDVYQSQHHYRLDKIMLTSTMKPLAWRATTPS